jgi:hypothetical protein
LSRHLHCAFPTSDDADVTAINSSFSDGPKHGIEDSPRRQEKEDPDDGKRRQFRNMLTQAGNEENRAGKQETHHGRRKRPSCSRTPSFKAVGIVKTEIPVELCPEWDEKQSKQEASLVLMEIEAPSPRQNRGDHALVKYRDAKQPIFSPALQAVFQISLRGNLHDSKSHLFALGGGGREQPCRSWYSTRLWFCKPNWAQRVIVTSTQVSVFLELFTY